MLIGVYTTLDSIKSNLDITDTSSDNKLIAQLINSSRLFDRLAGGRRFYPRRETRYYDHPDEDNVLRLDDDLLEIETLTTQNGNTTISSGNYFLMAGERYGITPYNRIVLKSDSTQTNFLYSGTIQQANAVTGIWGYHEHWADAWLDSLDIVQDNPLTVSATSLNVSDADGLNARGLTPRFSVGQILKIESEYLYVSVVDTTNNVLTVVRGINGTTAAQHANGTKIYIYMPMESITLAVLDLASFMYTVGGSRGIRSKEIGDYSVTYFEGIVVPETVLETALRYKRIRL